MSDIKFIHRTLNGLCYYGLWDYYKFQGCNKALFEIYSKSLWFMFLAFNVTQIIEMYNVRDDFPMLMENAGVTFLVLSFLFKTGTILFRKQRVERLLQVLREEEQRSLHRPEEEVTIYYRNVDQNWFVSKFFWAICWLTVVMFYLARSAEYLIMGPQELHHGKIPFLFSAWYPYNKFEKGKYELTYFHQIIIGWVGANYIGLGDTLIISFMIFAIGQFQMIQCSIRNMHLTANDRDLFEEKDVLDIYHTVVDIVKHHCRIIEYLNDLDDLINPIILMNFLVCSLMICAVGFEAIIAGLSVRLAQSLQYITALLIQLFLFYWHANEVTLESINVGNSVAESKWYIFSARVKQALLILLARAQKPSILSVGGFYPMSLATFLMILRATYSYLALFRNLYNGDEE